MMKAAVCYRFGQPLVIDEIAIDEPRVNEVKVQISACAICHSDILYMDGAWGGRLPTIFGHEASGIITSCGPGVEHVKNGDKVIVSLLRSCGECFFCSQQQSNLCEHVFATDEPRRLQTVHGMAVHRGLGTGCFAEFAVVHQSQVVKIPDKLNVSSASLLACGVITGFGSVVNTASVKPGSHVVIIGAGGVGINCIQAARISSAATITAIDPNPDRLDIAKRFGATHAANPDQIDTAEFIKELTMNRGADFVFVATGHSDAADGAFRLIRRGGTLVLVGMPPAGTHLMLESVDFIDANQSILGCKMGSANLQSDIPKLVDFYQSGKLELDQLVSGKYSLENINDAIEATRNGVGLRNVVIFN